MDTPIDRRLLLRRTVAEFVQSTLPLRPEEGGALAEPLAYLLPEEKLPQTNQPLTPTGRDLHEAFQDYKNDLDEAVVERLTDKANLRDLMSGGMCFIQSKSGSGKTFLVARVLAQLIHNHNKEKANDAPVILFSQLKLALERTLHQTDLTTATLSCMHLQGGEYSRVEDMIRSLGEGVFPDVDSGGPSAILFVDSLDEFDKSHLASLPHLDAGLRQSGILPIWSIRQLEFNKLGQDIVGESPRNLIAQDGDDAAGVSITLRLKQQWVREYLSPILEKRYAPGSDQYKKRDRWLRRSLSEYQLLHIPLTNVAGHSKTGRKKRFSSIIEHLLEAFDEMEKSWSTPKWQEAASGRRPITDDWMKLYKQQNSLLPSLIRSTLALRLVEHLRNETKANGTRFDDAMSRFSSVLASHAAGVLAKGKTLADKIPLENMADGKIILRLLRRVGYVVGPDDHPRFTHRDLTAAFVVHALLEGDISGEERVAIGDAMQNDTMFTPMFGPTISGENSSFEDNRDFHRRTGMVLAQLPPVSNKMGSIGAVELTGIWNGLVVPWAPDYSGEDKFNEGQNRLARNAMQNWEYRRTPMVIRGPPGTGKTWMGVERMLGITRHVSEHAGWVVTLNSTLAKVHKRELEYQHSQGPALQDLSGKHEERTNFLQKRVRVKGLTEILGDLAGDLWDEEKQINAKRLKQFWDNAVDAMPKTSDHQEHRKRLMAYQNRAMYDFRNIMFGLENTVLLDVETWKKESHHHPHSLWNSDLDESDLEGICTIWHKQIEVQLRNGFVARHSVAGRLLHRILVLRHLTEGESSPDEKELERLGFITGAKGDLNQILSTLKTRLSQYGVAGSIVIDEVQDMTPAEALLITLLCDFDEADAHRVMLAGDEFQTLNGNDFSWGTWVTRSHELAKILLDKIGQVNKEAAHGWHPLKAFTHLKEIDLPPHITQIQRNHPDIAEFFKQAWDWEMAPGRESNDAMKEAKALEKSGDNDSDLEPSEPVVGIFVQTDSHGLDTVSLIANWLKNLGDLGNVAIIVPDNGLRAELVMMIDDSELFLYDPFTIKGLEQDIVIVIGGYGVSNASEFSVLLNVKPENWTKEHHALFDRINRHMLVANSRAKQTHLSVYFEQDAARPISLKHNFTWRQFSLPDSIRYGHDEGSIPTWNLNDVASRLQTENRSRTWFLRSFHQLAQQFNRSQEDDRFAEQIERVQNAWWAKAQASVKSLETEDYESDPLLKLLISIDPEAKVRPNQPAPQLLALFLNQEKTFVDDAFGRALAEAQSLKDAIEEQMKSNLTNTEHFLEFIKKNRGKRLIPFSKVNDYVVLNKLLQNRRLETQRAKQNNRELQNALPKNISGWEVEEPRLKQDVAEMIDERICQVAADFDLMLGGEIDDLAVASRLIQTTPFQPVYAEDRISNVGGIRFYLESVMHALGEQRERPGTSPVLEATLQDYIPKLTAEFRKLAKQKTSQPVDSKTRELLGKVANLATVVYPSPSMLENVIDLHVVLESPIAPPENWFRVLIGESKTAAEGRPWLCDATYRKAKSLFRGKEKAVRMDMLNGINTTTRYSWESSLEAMSIALDEEVGVRGAEGGIAEDEVVAKAVKCIADIYHRLFILDRPSSIPRIHDKSSLILDQTMVHDLLRASMFSSNQNERIENIIAELNLLQGNVSAPTKVSVPVEGAILLAGMAILVDVFDQYRSPSSLETVQRRGHGMPALEQDEGYNTALGKIAASFKSKEAKRLFSKIVNADEPSIDCARIGELIYEQTTTRGVGSALAGHIWLQICRKIALKTFRQDDADIFAAMTPPEILDLEERGEIIHIDSLSFTWEKNDNTEATSYDWAWAIQPDGQRQKRVSEFLTECLAGGKIPVFINPDLFVGGEVVPRSGIPLKRYVVPLLNFESPTSMDEGGMVLLNLNDKDCLAVLDACKDGILDAISAAENGRPLWSSQVWPKLSERLKESLGTDIQVEEIQISCSPHLRSIEGRGDFVGLGSFLGSLHQYTTRAPEWFDSWIRDEIGFVREDGEMIAFLR